MAGEPTARTGEEIAALSRPEVRDLIRHMKRDESLRTAQRHKAENVRLREEKRELEMRLQRMSQYEDLYAGYISDRRRQQAVEEETLRRLQEHYGDKPELVRVLWHVWFADKYSRLGSPEVPKTTSYRYQAQLKAAGVRLLGAD